MKTYKSPRGFPLVDTCTGSRRVPVLTCELYVKWYALYLIMPDGRVEAADLDDLDQFTDKTAVGDHCWNPAALQGFAEARDWHIDEVALDLIMGRWVYNMGVEEKVL